jgi:DNA-directed RNA polymerase sigma subunit (sigma70/sigma32)
LLGTVERTDSLDWVLTKLSAAKKKPAETPALKKLTPPEPPKKFNSQALKQKDVELWKKWDENGRKPKDLAPLYQHMNRLVQSRVNLYKNKAEVPTSVIEHEHKKHWVNALKTWDPKKGTQLSSWVMTHLKKAGRLIEQNKNFARIPENISRYIGSYNSVKSELEEKLGHEPSAQDIHDHVLVSGHPTLGMLSLKTIQRLEREQRRGLIQSESDVEETKGAPLLSSRAEEVIRLIVHQLTPQERIVHEYTFGLGGKAQLKPGAIAKKLKWDNSKVSKLRTSAYNKMQPYLGND